MLDYFLEKLHHFFIRFKKIFLTTHIRPVYSAQYGLSSQPVSDVSKVGVVIQGPLIKEEDFTYQSICMYQNNFQGHPLIVSTWEDEDEELIQRISRLKGVYVVLSKKPAFPGTQHINFQIVSSAAGADKAKQLHCVYILKTRTDQRIYAPNVPEFLVNCINHFPIKKNSKQQGRIISSSLYSFKYRLYSISDMCLFGYTDDIIKYLSPRQDNRKIRVESANLLNYSKLKLGEMYLSTEFLAAVGHSVRWTLGDSWKAVAERFIIIDQQVLDIYWKKYTVYQEYKFLDYDTVKNSQILDFREWLNMYMAKNIQNKAPEHTLQAGFSTPVQLEM